jgi:outer membrane murein-binding lipoprotein Lpp
MDTGLWIGAIAVGLTAVSIISNAIQFRSKAAVDTVTILKGAIDTLRADVADLKAKLDQCHTDCEQLRAQVLAEGGERLRQQLAEAERCTLELQGEYDKLHRELAKAMRELAEVRGDLSEVPDG